MDPQTAEAGETYLNGLGFRSLIEWVTAEVLLSRPEDPLAFIRSILDEKLAERPPGEKYQGDHALSYIKQCYAAASASADENGRIVIKPRKIATPAPSSNLATLTTVAPDPALLKRLAIFEKVIEACRLIAMQLGPLEATMIIVKQACVVLNAERATLFTYDKATNMLVLKVSEGAADIRVPYGKGIAGNVAATGKTVNLVDAYSDPTFDPSYDLQTGYKTKSMLCVPVRNGANQIVGVVQVLNKAGATEKEQKFNEVDEEILGMLAAQAGIALENSRIHTEACLARERVKDVLSIVQDMHRDLGFISLMFTMSTRIQKLINSDRCTLYIVDRAKNELWTLQGEVNIRVPLNQGISGAAAEANQSINLENAYDDPRFNQEFDQKHGYVTRSVLAMPLRDHVGEVIGVVQLINKMSDPGFFTSDDEELLGTFLQIAGPILETSQSHLPKTTQAKDVGAEFPGKVVRAAQDVVEMNVISENDEEES
uniref:GAF domain-containing protein n=1 Tax=Globisporangium ultimum (strain ATCC 200006 / CBS 805.95 / DAOM BR144) TaxID=431595 RepID=K3WKQ8_GLOUD